MDGEWRDRVRSLATPCRVRAEFGGKCLAAVTFDKVSKIYADGTKAVNAIDLGIADGEFMVLVGPSGCGKTTALRMVAGLEEISEGTVRIGDRPVNHVPSRDRDIAMVFQSYALYPHLTVYENIAFGLRLKRLPKDEIDKRVQQAAQTLGLEEQLKRKPRNLSGGQRQRVAMGRAIVREPAAFLMDEPLSNLDAKLRVQMRAEISRIQRDLGVTTLYVTHDQVEAMTMGDRVAVMRKGELQQVDEPQTLYDRPVNLFVGGFIGSPAMNMLEGTVERRNGGFALSLGSQTLGLGEAGTGAQGLRRTAAGRRHQAGAPRGSKPRPRRAGRPPPAWECRAPRGAWIGADRPLLDRCASGADPGDERDRARRRRRPGGWAEIAGRAPRRPLRRPGRRQGR